MKIVDRRGQEGQGRMSVQREATRAAERVLDSVWSGGSDNPVLPVDSAWIAGKYGIDVYETPLDDDVFALLVKEPGQDPLIALNESDGDNRKRFSCAHELGHFICRADGFLGVEQYSYRDKRGPLSSAGDDPDEVYANTFAASLLMPARAVEEMVDARMHPSQMALRFHVAADAVHYRLENLGDAHARRRVS